jgi:hypothetical protein
MKKRVFARGLALVGVVVLAGCGSRMSPPEKLGMSNNACIGMADSLKSLRVGDELPRVVQVLGQPKRVYRVIAPFGRAYDVSEYDVGETPCARLVLNSGKKLQVVFDDEGRYVGAGKSWYRTMQAATLVRVKGVPVDIRQFGN